MKITNSQLKRIIKEEIIKEMGSTLGNFGGQAGALGTVAGRKGQELDKADQSEYGPVQLAEDSLIGLLADLGHTLVEWERREYRSDEVRYKSYFQDLQKLLEEYDPCAHRGQKCDEAHPGQTHEECIEVTINKDLYEVLTEKEIEEALGMDQEGQLYSKILPSLMQVAGNNAGIALEMLEALKTHLEESEEVIGAGIEEREDKNNPWAICTASVGREDKEKYEKCVKSVKKQKRGKK